MRLAFVAVHHYRGIGALELTLDSLTTLIGENSYGKSNLLDALLVCLGVGSDGGGFPFLVDDFRENGDGGFHPIDVRLGFRETADGEWDRPPFEAFGSLVWHGPRGDRRLELRVRAVRSGEPPTIATECAFVDGAGNAFPSKECAALVDRVRHQVPVLVLKADRYFTRPSRTAPAPSGPPDRERRLATEIADLIRSIGDLHRPQLEGDLKRGFEAAVAYVERFGGPRLRERMSRFLPASPQGIGTSSAARAIALLLVLGPLLDARRDGAFGADARPVIAIEDAEAHLHPVVLASVAALIQAIPGERIVTTNSGDLISMMPLASVRRLVRHGDETRVYRLGRDTLHADDVRRIAYHVRANRGSSLFARAWLLVEGETEFWLLPELAAELGIDFALEGIRCMEFAQCGVAPLVRFADALGIEWHLLADGDRAGQAYAEVAMASSSGRSLADRVTRLEERDVEHTLWASGFADVYRHAIPSSIPRRTGPRRKVENPSPTIERAVRARSKPGMALAIIDALHGPNPPAIPPLLRRAIEMTARLARESFGDTGRGSKPRHR